MTPADTRTARRLARLDAALAALRETAERLAAALPPAPGARDPAAIAALAGEIAPRGAALAEAASWLRRRGGRDEPAAERPLAAARAAEKALPRIQAALAPVLEDRRWPLLPRPAADPAEARRTALLGDAFIALELAINGALQDPGVAETGYPFVPLAADRFLDMLQAAWRLRAAMGLPARARFLEMGAGAGAKLFLAREVFGEAVGVEIDPGYVARAGVLGEAAEGVSLLEGDALTYEHYGAFDVIYFFVPFRDLALEDAFEQRLWEMAAPGTVVLAPMLRRSFLHGLPALAPGVFVKGVEGAALGRLRAEAERVGPTVPPPARRRVPGERRNPLAPLVAALDRAGLAP